MGVDLGELRVRRTDEKKESDYDDQNDGGNSQPLDDAGTCMFVPRQMPENLHVQNSAEAPGRVFFHF